MGRDVELQVDLQEGFSGEAVTVHLGGEEIWQTPGARTRLQIGLADSFAKDVAPGRHRLDVRIPSRDLHAGLELDITGPCWVRVNLTDGGELIALAGDEPPRYA